MNDAEREEIILNDHPKGHKPKFLAWLFGVSVDEVKEIQRMARENEQSNKIRPNTVRRA